MMFDELHDPEPLDVGLHQFAIVAERARAIRRRRTTIGVRTACIGFVALGAAAVWSAMPGSGGDPGPLEQLPSFVVTTQSTAPPTTVQVTATTPTSDVTPVPLTRAAMLPSLPPIALAGPVVVEAGGRDVEIHRDASRRVCARSADADLGCSEPDVRLYVTEIAAVDDGTDVAPDASTATVHVVVVDDDVRLNFLTVGAACAPGDQAGRPPTVRVWVCEGLDVDRTTVEDRGSGVVLIATRPDR